SDAATALARDLSVLDFMRRDLSRLRTLAPGSEKARIDAHADAIQQLETTLRQSPPGSGATCVIPAAPPMFPLVTGTQTDLGSSTNLSGVNDWDPADPTNHPHQVLGQTYLALVKAAFL